MKKIKILGTGCPKCNKLFSVAEKAAQELNVEFTIEKVSDINEIISYGVMITPALVVNGAVKVVGKVPPFEEVKKLIS